MEITSSNIIINRNNTNRNHNNLLMNKNIFKLNYNNSTYDIELMIEENDSNKVIKMKCSKILNDCFYLYEEIIDNRYLQQIPTENNNLEGKFQKLIFLFKNKKARIENIILDNSITIKININEKDKLEIKLLKINKDLDFINKELIRKYSSLEKDYIKLKYNNNFLQRQIQRLTNQHQNQIHNYNPFNYSFYRNNIKQKNEEEKDDENHISLKIITSVWCMLKLNPINYTEDNKSNILNLAAIGLGNGNIILINLSTLKIHQGIKSLNTIYSLAQFNNNPNYLLCSLSNGYIIIYKLNNRIYEEIQRLQKPQDLRRGEFNKVITLSNGDLATAERGAISIWKQKKDNEGKKIEEFEFYKEILTNYDTCQIVEVNPNVFACAIYTSKQIKVFNNNGKDYPLLGVISNAESQGSNSNGMAKINDRIFCSGGKNYYIYIVGVNPVQMIQKIKLVKNESLSTISFMHMSNSGYLFTSYNNKIIQFKVCKDENNNFIELEEIFTLEDKEEGSSSIITTDNGKIFYQQKRNNFGICFYFTNFKMD